VQIDVMAIRPRMLELAARIGDGVSLSTGASRGYLTGAVAAIESALAESGRDRSEVRIMGGALAAMAPDREQAIDLLMPMLKLFGGGALGVTAPDLFDAEEIAALGGDPEKEAELITPEVAPQLGFVATPDTVAEALVEFKATGIDELNLDFVTPPVESAGLIEALADGWRAMEATAHDAPR
jgi:alkanesulfonate monooxygenase SsuD/methylene tetrahydromethanopterin reductase-like flavin-dependent oxidoreductase (luciferase family)